MKGIIHCHSENSRYDSPMNVVELCKRASELGYEAVALTDHGTLTGIDDFVAAAKDFGIKPIPGVEAYVSEAGSSIGRLHLLLIAKDDLGYQGIGKAVSESNRNIDENGFPLMNKDILMKYFGKDSVYHGHVIATSACVGGVLSGILLSPLKTTKEINSLKRKQDKYEEPDNPSYLNNIKTYHIIESQIEKLTEDRAQIDALSKKAYKKREKTVEKLKETDPEAYKIQKEALQKEMAESEAAKEALPVVREKISLMKKRLTQVNNVIKESKVKQEKWRELQNDIDELNGRMISTNRLYNIVKNEARFYSDIFGKENFYIEIQYHGFLTDDEDAEIECLTMPLLIRMAKELNIPIVGANDAHIARNDFEHVRARQIICSLRLAKKGMISQIRKGDSELYLKTEEELREALSHVADASVVDEAIKNAYKICEECNCEFKYGTHYPKFKGLIGTETADNALRRMAYAGIENRFPDKEGWTSVYEERLEYELSVIAKMGYSDYFLIVQDFLAFGRKLGCLNESNLKYLKENIKSMTLYALIEYVESHQTDVGFVVGAGRGSAAGSLTAYLVGITNIIDPIKYDLLFERFLNEDRVSMPDVDSDFSPEIRDLVVEYCKKLYGVESVANIVTKGYMAPKGAVRNTARVIGIEKDQRDYYLSLADKIAKKIPSKIGTSFETCKDDLLNSFAAKEDDDDEKAQMKKDAREIIEQAMIVENVFLNYGMHAAGVIIADGQPIENYVPLMRDEKSGDMKVQCNMVQAEEIHGLLKFDFLGLRNLNIVTLAIRYIYKNHGVKLNVENLPFEKEVFENIFATGKTGSVFQFESSGMKQMLRASKPDCFEDLVALVSLYRPGPMSFIPQYIESKAHPESIHYRCKELEPILKKTYGIIIYQEQVMEIVQKLAGFSLSQADNVRRYMSKKKMDKLEKERTAFVYGDEKREIRGCVKIGINETVANEIFDDMIDFAKYAFNKSHAAAYAALSYITGYLKYHYAAEYMCAVLNCTNEIKKMPSVLNDCREIGVQVLPPDINKSGLDFTVSDGSILFGLNSIKGTKIAFVKKILDHIADAGAYASFKDFLKSNVSDKSTAEGLIKSGAMDSFKNNRMALMKAYEVGNEMVSKLNDKDQALQKLMEEPEEKKETKRYINSYNKTMSEYQMLEEQFKVFRIEDCPEDQHVRMKNEKEVLGFFITAHPLDHYRSPSEMGCLPIDSVESSLERTTVMGLIENYRVVNRKSDNKPMAFFDLEDKTGTIHICCFTDAYAKYEELLGEDQVVQITGKVSVDDSDSMEDAEPELQIVMERIKPLKPDLSTIKLFIPSIVDWNSYLKALYTNNYITDHGHPLTIYDRFNGEYRPTRFYVKPTILDDSRFVTRQ